jgi:hypothetical protein
LYYRFARYLPDACPGTPIVIGNWPDGEARPVAAECVDQEWLAFDTRRSWRNSASFRT